VLLKVLGEAFIDETNLGATADQTHGISGTQPNKEQATKVAAYLTTHAGVGTSSLQHWRCIELREMLLVPFILGVERRQGNRLDTQ
jgi:hypothetical protein